MRATICTLVALLVSLFCGFSADAQAGERIGCIENIWIGAFAPGQWHGGFKLVNSGIIRFGPDTALYQNDRPIISPEQLARYTEIYENLRMAATTGAAVGAYWNDTTRVVHEVDIFPMKPCQ